MADPDKKSVKPAEAPSQPPAAEAAKPASPEVDAYEESLKQRMDLLKEVTAGNAPPGQPAEANPGQAAAGKEPYSAPEKSDMPAKPMTEAKKKNKEFADFVQKSRMEAQSASLGELIGKLMESVSNLSGLLSGFMDKLSGSAKKAAEKAIPADKFSKDELDKIKVDLYKDKDKPFEKDKSAEYVVSVLGLPVKETPQKLLDALIKSNLFFSPKLENLKDVMPGDVVFSKKKNEKGEPYANLCAVVSTLNPLRIKLVPEGGGPPKEMSMEDFKKNYDFYGFVKLPRKEGQTPPQPAEAPADTSAPPAETPAVPAETPSAAPAQTSAPPAAPAAPAPEPQSKDKTPPQPSTPS